MTEHRFVIVKSWQSISIGVCVSLLVGLLAVVLIDGTLMIATHARATVRALSIVGIPFFLFTGIAFFVTGLYSVGYQRWAVERELGGAETGRIFLGGLQWVFPFIRDLIEFPGRSQILPIKMPEDAPEAKDLIKIIIGHKRKPIVLASIFDPILYSAAIRSKVDVVGFFWDNARKFVNQMTYAKGIIDEKSLFDDYMQLPYLKPRGTSAELFAHPEYQSFKERMMALRAGIPDEKGEVEAREVFTEDAINQVMGQAGVFLSEMATIGLRVRRVLAPSIDLPEGVEAEAEQKQVEREKREALKTKAEFMRTEARKFKDELGTTGDDALDRMGLIEGQKVERKAFGVPGLKEGLTAIASAIVTVGNAYAAKAAAPTDQPKP